MLRMTHTPLANPCPMCLGRGIVHLLPKIITPNSMSAEFGFQKCDACKGTGSVASPAPEETPQPELDGAELRRSAAENTWDDLFDENVNLRAELDALTARAEQAEAQNTRLQQLLANLAIGIGAADGFGYRAKHGLAVVQELFETVDAEILKQAEQVSQGEV